MEQNWHSVDDCMPMMRRTHPDYKKRLSTFHEYIVRGIDTATEYNTETGKYEDITYWVYSVARLMNSYDLDTGEWYPSWDCQNEFFWPGGADKITHWMDLGDSQVSTILEDISEDE